MLSTLKQRGFPVPPGFVVSDVACRRFLEVGEFPAGMWEEVEAAVARLVDGLPPDRPALLAVRSSPPVEMPGILGRALHVGCDEAAAARLAAWHSPEFAAQVRLEFLRGVAAQRKVPEHRVAAVAATAPGAELEALERDVAALEELIVAESQRPIPDHPLEQLREGIQAVFASWDDAVPHRFRRRHDVSDDLGTSVIVHVMALGSVGSDSGAGVAFSRDPRSGEPRTAGVFAPGEAQPGALPHYPGLENLASDHPDNYAEVVDILCELEGMTCDMMRIDFIRERDALWLVEARPGERSSGAGVRIVVDLANAGMITRQEAVARIDPDSLDDILHARLDAPGAMPLITAGAASPGAAAGEIVLDSAEAIAAKAAGRPVILVRRETTPEDLAGVIAADGVLTSHGGPTSHAAVAARGTGTPAVTGANNVVVDVAAGIVHIGDTVMRSGDGITIDGGEGTVYAGMLPLEIPQPSEHLDQLLEWADEFRRMEVWANADTPDAAAHAKKLGAEGIGLARTEYMFSGDRLEVVRTIILTDDAKERTRALEQLEELQIADFERLLESMDGQAVVVRLLDPPLHEFLPDRREVDAYLRNAAPGSDEAAELRELLVAIDQWEESNPMLGLRGVRLAVVIPEIYRNQVLAALEAVRRRLDDGGDPRLELMIPLVGSAEEVHLIRDMIDEEVHYAGRQLDVTVGTMIELPRAALTADEFALESDFFSFGTNDLTQTTLGISRDDAEEAFLRTYLEKGMLRRDPFTSIDRRGVGKLIETAIAAGRAVNPGIVIGVCGEHGGDPDSIDFFESVGVDYVSCSPPRIPVARLAAAQAALRHGIDA
ncbi:MAG TPA: putative PEP-binding protein [Acidimicrobiia bacterium]|jgi:pyruvate,orthophosphate dikinase|nr:putative PEP-binding protein [Acidimicrobiia bacterium]